MSLFHKKPETPEHIDMSEVVELRPNQSRPTGGFIAKRDFVISHNDYHREIKEGDDISDVPDTYWPNLRAEGVI